MAVVSIVRSIVRPIVGGIIRARILDGVFYYNGKPLVFNGTNLTYNKAISLFDRVFYYNGKPLFFNGNNLTYNK